VDISEYDQFDEDDPSLKGMGFSLKNFEEFLQNKTHKNKPIVLVFNKYDIFKEKIKNVDLNISPLFKDCKGELEA
jgi:GTPase SAR1 family protein